MNSFIETLNQWSENFLAFAWPMFWQSSLLIVMLFIFNLLFRRKLRASLRYALWLVVMVKLCVPPTLALPTNPAWWLHKTPPPVVAKPTPRYTVTYDQGPLLQMPTTPLPAIVPTRPAMTYAAWLLAVSAIVSLALLLWLLVRWWQITRLVNGAATSERLTFISDTAQNFVGMRFKVQVKLTTNSMSPAVCGLFRPAILIPQPLAENFSDDQLRAVLLHELIHLRRRDVWVNFVQALLQIVYWWHPLVWLTNAHIRRVREEAVDDAVMLALRDEAESYAPTLLEVAKLALNRPLASLGLVGILESRHALRQRIERLVDFRPPRRAGLTLVSLLGILAFTAVAVPMGEGPAPAEKQTVAALAISTPMVETQKWNPFSVLIASSFYQVSAVEFEKIVAGLKLNPSRPGNDPWWSASPEKFRELISNLKSSGFHVLQSPRIQTGSGQGASFYTGDGTNNLTLDCTPLVVGGAIDLTIQGKVVVTLAQVTFSNQFSAKISAENHGGIVLRVEKLNGFAESNLVVVANVQIITNVPTSRHQRVGATNIADTLANPNYRVVLNALEQRSGRKPLAEPEVITTSGRGVNRIKTDDISAIPPQPVLSKTDYDGFMKRLGFEGSPISPLTNLLSRHFKVDPKTFVTALQNVDSLQNTPRTQTNNVIIMAKDFFKTLGVDLDVPGKTVFYKDRLGELFVRATQQDLDTIENALEVLSHVPPQIHIKARFVEVPKGTLGGLLESVIPITNLDTRSNQFAGLVGILTDKNFKTMLHNLEARPGVETLAEPEVVTFSGRQTQFRATVIQTIVTNFAFKEAYTNASVVPQTESVSVENGPVLDVVPYVLSDGYTINLTVIPSLIQFLGYDTPAPTNKNTAYTRAGEKIDLPKILPRFSVRQAVATLNLWDGQTAIISGLPGKDEINGKEVSQRSKSGDKELLVFVTVTIVDPAGNPIHSYKAVPANIYDPVILR
ncbi:MAG: M56 family metallopeptidase [Limisphaerales bacterium]